jgi:hypothetical protein
VTRSARTDNIVARHRGRTNAAAIANDTSVKAKPEFSPYGLKRAWAPASTYWLKRSNDAAIRAQIANVKRPTEGGCEVRFQITVRAANLRMFLMETPYSHIALGCKVQCLTFLVLREA